MQMAAEGAILFFVDNQAALKALMNMDVKLQSVKNTINALNELGTRNSVTLTWVRAHVGTEGNKQADEAAKRGSKSSRMGPKVGLALATVNAQIDDETLRQWTYKWEHNGECRQTKYFWQGPNIARSKVIVNANRTNVGRLVRFLTGHTFLKRQNAIVNRENTFDPLGNISCRLCDTDAEETPHHLITDCGKLSFWRAGTMGDRILGEFPEWDPLQLIEFLGYYDITKLEDEIDDVNRFEFEFDDEN